LAVAFFAGAFLAGAFFAADFFAADFLEGFLDDAAAFLAAVVRAMADGPL